MPFKRARRWPRTSMFNDEVTCMRRISMNPHAEQKRKRYSKTLDDQRSKQNQVYQSAHAGSRILLTRESGGGGQQGSMITSFRQLRTTRGSESARQPPLCGYSASAGINSGTPSFNYTPALRTLTYSREAHAQASSIRKQKPTPVSQAHVPQGGYQPVRGQHLRKNSAILRFEVKIAVRKFVTKETW